MKHRRHHARLPPSLVVVAATVLLSPTVPRVVVQAQGSGLMPNPLGMLAPWPYGCQEPIPLGHPCTEDNDCDTGVDTGLAPQHCHLVKRVCSYGVPPGGPCNEGRHCGPDLGCKATPAVMECYPLSCDATGKNCTQGPTTGRECVVDEAGVAVGCATDGSEVCNNSLRPLPSGECFPLIEKEGEDCTFFIAGPACGKGLQCPMGTGACARDVGGDGQPCPLPPDRCDAGLACISEWVEPYRSWCQAPRPVGAHCNAGGECVQGAYCDNHDLVCKAIRPAGSSCRNGNECGEAPFDAHIGVDCVRWSCVDTAQAGASCWPGYPFNQCTNGRTCRKRATGTWFGRRGLKEEEEEVEVDVLAA